MIVSNKFMYRIIFCFIANRATKEIHRLKNQHTNCRLKHMSWKNKFHCTRLWAWYLIRFKGYNGCRWCFPEKDKG